MDPKWATHGSRQERKSFKRKILLHANSLRQSSRGPTPPSLLHPPSLPSPSPPTHCPAPPTFCRARAGVVPGPGRVGREVLARTRPWPSQCRGPASPRPELLHFRGFWLSFQPAPRHVAKQYISQKVTEAKKYRIESVEKYGGEKIQNLPVQLLPGPGLALVWAGIGPGRDQSNPGTEQKECFSTGPLCDVARATPARAPAGTAPGGVPEEIMIAWIDSEYTFCTQALMLSVAR